MFFSFSPSRVENEDWWWLIALPTHLMGAWALSSSFEEGWAWFHGWSNEQKRNGGENLFSRRFLVTILQAYANDYVCWKCGWFLSLPSLSLSLPPFSLSRSRALSSMILQHVVPVEDEERNSFLRTIPLNRNRSKDKGIVSGREEMLVEGEIADDDRREVSRNGVLSWRYQDIRIIDGRRVCRIKTGQFV